MARHATDSRSDVRTVALLMIALTAFVVAMIASYSGAFAKPALHHLTVAVAGPPQLVDALRGQDALDVHVVADAAAARDEVYDRAADTAFVVTADHKLDVLVAGGGGRSVANAAQTVGQAVAAKAGLPAVVDDVAPTTPGDPQGTVVFYAVIFLSIGASVGAALFGRIMGMVHRPKTLLLRTLSLTGCAALLAGAVTVYVDPVLGALTGHTWELFGALWLYAMAVGGAVTGVAAALGNAASLVLTMFLVVVGNAAAAGPVGRPLLSGFYETFSWIVPQGSGVSLLRSVQYFGGHGALTPILTLLAWAASGALLAVIATAVRLNYRAVGERFAGRGRAVLRPGVLSPAD
jgi:hypothetical protein